MADVPPFTRLPSPSPPKTLAAQSTYRPTSTAAAAVTHASSTRSSSFSTTTPFSSPPSSGVRINDYAVQSSSTDVYYYFTENGVEKSYKVYYATDSSSSASGSDSDTYTYIYDYYTENGVKMSVHVHFASSSLSHGSSASTKFSPSVATGTSGSNSTGSGNGGDGSPPSRTSMIIGVSVAVGVLVLFILGVYLLIRRRRAKHGVPPLSEKPGRGGVSPIDTSVASGSAPSSAGYEDVRLSRGDAFDVVPLPPLPVRYSRVPPLQPPSRMPSRSSRASAQSSWADDSEFDALATDGSSSTRTLSTYSHISEDTIRGSGEGPENPFDHPAYTLVPSRRDVIGGGGSAVGTYNSSMGMPSALSHSFSNPSHDPFSDPASPTDSTPGQSPIATVPPAISRNGTLQIEDDLLLSDPLSRGATIIQHIDGGRHLAPERARLPPETRTGEGEVHIPPTYNALFP